MFLPNRLNGVDLLRQNLGGAHLAGLQVLGHHAKFQTLIEFVRQAVGVEVLRRGAQTLSKRPGGGGMGSRSTLLSSMVACTQ